MARGANLLLTLGRHRRIAARGGGGASSLLTSLVGYWKLDEASGTRADSHTNALNLTDNNTVTQAVGKVGNAGQFTRANSESLSRASEAALQTGDIDFTIAAWAYRDSSNDQGIVSKTGGTREFILFHTADQFRFYVSSDGGFGAGQTTVDNSQVVSNGTWYLVIAWHDAAANTINIQVNDNTVVSAAHAGGAFVDTNTFAIGEAFSLHWDGRIDEVGFWKRVLTASERTALYNGGSGVTYPFTGV